MKNIPELLTELEAVSNDLDDLLRERQATRQMMEDVVRRSVELDGSFQAVVTKVDNIRHDLAALL